MTEILFYILIFINVIAFTLYGTDKHKAVKNRRRISEKTLLLWGVFAPFGSFAAMKLFRHKTRKLKFSLGLPVLLCLHILLLIFLQT